MTGNPESSKEQQWQAELDRIKSALLDYLDENKTQELFNDIHATAMVLNSIVAEILATLKDRNKKYEYDGELLIIGDVVQPLYNGIYYLKSITAESLAQAHEFGGPTGVINQIEKTKADLNTAIAARDKYRPHTIDLLQNNIPANFPRFWLQKVHRNSA